MINPVATAKSMSIIIATEAINLRPMNLLMGGLSGSFLSIIIMALNRLKIINRIKLPIKIFINIDKLLELFIGHVD